jgi:hypothetical protein
VKVAAPSVQNADHAIAQCRAPMCQGRGVCRTGEGGLGDRALVPAEGVEVFCFQSLIDFSEPLRLVRSLFRLNSASSLSTFQPPEIK